jgi:LacI family transcriptional regulator
MKKRVGIRDVASKAGVSVATVSQALYDVEGARINADTRQRVREAAESLGYSPNHFGRGLRLQRSQTVGLLSDNIATTPFAGKIIVGAQDAAAAHGALLILMNTSGDPELERREAQLLVQQRQVDGVLYASMYHREVDPPEVLGGLPLVLLNAVSADPSLSSVAPDEVAGGRDAANELLRAGHRRLAFLNNTDDIPAVHGRKQGFLAALKAAGIPSRDSVIAPSGDTPREGYDSAMALLSAPDRPTGVFCFNDYVAMGVYQAAAELGLRIPQDLSVVGFDNIEIVAEGLRPGLTTIELPHYEMGVWAVDQLYARLEAPDGELPPVQTLKIAGPVIRRSSVTEPPRP